MIRKLVDFALNNRFVVITAALLVLIAGALAFHDMPVEAYPDIADNYVTIISQWPGRSAEEVEQQVSIPIEIQMGGLPHLASLRSESLFGLSYMTLVFDDASVNDWNRAKVLERLTLVSTPPGVQPQIGTDWSLTGQIYWYTIRSTNPSYDLMDQRSIEDWVLYKQFKTVPNVVDVSDFGGTAREYQVRIDPSKLISYGLSIAQVEQQLTVNNVNAGGSFVEVGLQQMNVRALGLYRTVQDIENTVLTTKSGTAIRIKDIGIVEMGPRIRLGHMARATHRPDGVIVDEPDVIQGSVLMLKGAQEGPTLDAIHKKVDELNTQILPEGVKLIPMLDRSDLLHFTLHTVLHNLGEGMILVTVILLLFLGNIRAAIIVAITIPFSLMFASIWLDLNKIPANLLSLGALDFGMMVDGAVVMVENIVRHLNRRQQAVTQTSANGSPGRITVIVKTPAEAIREACHEVQRPVFYAIAIIITAYLPIFTLQRVEGKLFKPMAWTVAFALLGALTYAILVAPVLANWFFSKGVKEWHNPVMEFLVKRYRNGVRMAIDHRWVTIGIGLAGFAVAMYLTFSGIIGAEFLPHLDEGAIWARGAMANSTSLTEGERFATQSRHIFASFPEVTTVVSQAGAPDDGTDTGGFGNTEFFVDLKPKEQWRPIFKQDKAELIAAMNRELDKYPGAFWNFSQPIEDNVDETLTGTKGGLAAKLYGPDLDVLEAKGEEIKEVMSHIPGIHDLGLQRDTGEPNLNITVDRQAAARFGINVADVQDAIQTAVGGFPVGQVLQGEAVYNLTARYQKQYRDTKEAIQDIRILSPSGERVSLAQVAKVQVKDGAYDIYRENGSRYVSIRFEVRDRDLGSTVEEAITKIGQQVKLPRGYQLKWAGEYESEKRAEARLLIIIPITILVIFVILYTMFNSAKWATLILITVAMARVGGLVALLVTHTFFSVASGVGFLALFGVSVQTGVIMLEYINQLRAHGHTVVDAAVEGAVLRLRPIMMTMLVATFGLLPAAFSHAIGSDSQRPFAIVIVGGLIADLVMSIFILPTLYVWFASDGDKLPEPEANFEV
ncbi:MAG TPA: CusA/CzcA family heavy metal efflux RND transporter [Candidatus Saccharimonadales bacterium]|jgi:cobalt-zinc-cadmium resistance protein CzcA|nr:CusA/CzcA family heavy metal efflux RND transporter [Candidatus Saccharimonadales bacterium]